MKFDKSGYEVVPSPRGTFYAERGYPLHQQVLLGFGAVFNDLPFHQLIGLKLFAIDRKRLVARIAFQKHLLALDSMHGGVIATSLDAVGLFRAMNLILLKELLKEDYSTFCESSEGCPIPGVPEKGLLMSAFKRMGLVKRQSLEVTFQDKAESKIFEISASTVTEDGVGRCVNDVSMADETGNIIGRAQGTYIVDSSVSADSTAVG